MQNRRVQVIAAAAATTSKIVLAASALAVLYSVYAFGQHRFFTVDEYQYGHATWLVSQGEVPYRDFYEHHFPLSYALHAPLAAGEASFPVRALRLRLLASLYALSAALLLGWAAYRATGEALTGWLSVVIPPAIGFSLMSAIDYRADNFGAFLFLACLALLEVNRQRARSGSAQPGLAFGCGVLLALSLGMTQKMVVLGGGPIALLLALDLAMTRQQSGRLRAALGGRPFVSHPGAFCLGGGLTGLALLAIAAGFGMLTRGFEITIFEAMAHEVFYPAVSWLEYASPYFCAAPVTTSLIAGFALVYFALAPTGDRVFWGVALGVSLLGGALIKAQYPYNYVLLCFLVGVCAVRGYALVARRIVDLPRFEAISGFGPLLWLIPLALLPEQLGFVADKTSNAHQLALLAKIERFSTPSDAVIDNSGGALFRPHGSYYYQHGRAHRTMFEDYFSEQLVDDYRRSRALLWIIDYRLLDLPESVHSYFLKHYVRVDGSLFALGFHSPLSRGGELVQDIDVIREGDYYVFPAPLRLSKVPHGLDSPDRPFDLRVDGEPVTGDRVHLAEGAHRITVLPGAPAYLLSLLPPDAFLLGEKDRFWRELEGAKAYQLLFEYGEPCR